MIPHPIRLRHPWDESPGASSGQTTYRRAFKQPTGLDAWERVFLEVDRTLVSASVILNGHSIGHLEYGQFFSTDITSLLQLNNELQVTVETVSAPSTTVSEPNPANRQQPPSHSVYLTDPAEPIGSPIGDVRLLIRTVHPGAGAETSSGPGG
jgi:hypothetical protein